MQRTWFTRRSLVASILALVYPGLGHLYLRAWLRAIAWFVVALIAAAMVMPESAYAAYEAEGFSGLLEASQNLPMDVILSMLVVRVLNALDAYLTGLQKAVTKPESEAAAGTCPECGKDLDEELDFCPWCTTRLEPDDNEPEPTVRR
ncbi:MAG: zinc ribbon domain-containing protein [Halodesulfurarchaeum sp.]|nr:zinc ribbon domain-containing protein [Halodesulfurarchaeum sp.]